LSRRQDLVRFYSLMNELERRIGGGRLLGDCDGRMGWPRKGVYFFFEIGEQRSDTGTGARVVRVGTHALNAKSKTTLWKRLSQHRGTVAGRHGGGGNHRGSIFRLHVGAAIAARDEIHCPTWGRGSSAPRDVKDLEADLERLVSSHIRSMPFLWLAVEGFDGEEWMRGYVESNSIALLSNRGGGTAADPPSSEWLGRHSQRDVIRESGLWNVNHVRDVYDPEFLDYLEKLVFH
jgi:hypothetical protein